MNWNAFIFIVVIKNGLWKYIIRTNYFENSNFIGNSYNLLDSHEIDILNMAG